MSSTPEVPHIVPVEPEAVPAPPVAEYDLDSGVVINEADLVVGSLLAEDREPNQPGQPRSFISASREKRAERKRQRAGLAAAERAYVLQVYGGERSNTLGFGAHVAKFIRNTSVGRAQKRGELTTEEQRSARHHIAATPMAFENPEQRRTNNKQKGAHKKAGIPLPSPAYRPPKTAKTDEQRRRAMERVAAVPGASNTATRGIDTRTARLDYPKIPGYQYAQDLDAIDPAYYPLFKDAFVEDIARSITQRIKDNLDAGMAYSKAKLEAQNEVITAKVDQDTPEDIKRHLLIAQLVAANLIDKPQKAGKPRSRR